MEVLWIEDLSKICNAAQVYSISSSSLFEGNWITELLSAWSLRVSRHHDKLQQQDFRRPPDEDLCDIDCPKWTESVNYMYLDANHISIYTIYLHTVLHVHFRSWFQNLLVLTLRSFWSPWKILRRQKKKTFGLYSVSSLLNCKQN